MKTTLVMISGVICAAAVGVAWNVARAAHEAAAARAAVAQTEAGINAQIQRTEERLAAAESEEANLRSILDGLQKAKSTTTAVPPSQSPPPAVLTEALAKKLAESRELASRPMAQLRKLADQRRYSAQRYRPLFGTLGLSPAQTEKFFEIKMKMVEHSMDMEGLVVQGVVSRNDPVVAKLEAEAKAKADAAYRELLGESGYQRLQEYNRTGLARDMISGFAGVAVMAGTPFTTQQLEQLVQIIANGSSSYRNGQSVVFPLESIDWDFVNAQARPLMTDAQWTLFMTTASPFGITQHMGWLAGAKTKTAQAEAKQSTKPPGR